MESVTRGAIIRASQGKRFTNYILDQIFTSILTLLFYFNIGLFEQLTGTSTIFGSEESAIMDYILAFFLVSLYYILFEYFTGKSLAKYITKTRVVTLKNERPDIKEIFIRTLCRFIPFEQFSFLGNEASGWHDSISRTKVIEDNDFLILDGLEKLDNRDDLLEDNVQ